MTVQELEDAITNITENSVKKLKIRSWIAVELGRLINRKYYWWRKNILTIPVQSGVRTYNLNDVNNPLSYYPDFVYFASSLYRFNPDGSQSEVPFTGDHRQIMQMVYSDKNGDPTVFTIEPGTTQTVRFDTAPTADAPYRGMYYSGYIVDWTSPGEKELPLIPPAYHYVALATMERRAFQYLYGQKDPRAIIAAQAEQVALNDLDSYKSPSTVHVAEFRSGDERSFVQSTQ